MTIVHVVLFEFKSELSATEVKAGVNRMLDLEKKCIHPKTQKPYIRSIVGGTNNSKEGISDSLSHGFVVHFESEEDRDYYCDKDPVHQEFKSSVKDVVVKATVFDFMPGVFSGV